MISVEYTSDLLEGEPGPNFYWRGRPSDYRQLVMDLHRLGTDHGIEVSLNDLGYIQPIGDIKIFLISSKGGRTLCSRDGSNVIMDLDRTIWRRVLEKLLSVSFEQSHNYVEFDDLKLEESANVIVSSDA